MEVYFFTEDSQFHALWYGCATVNWVVPYIVHSVYDCNMCKGFYCVLISFSVVVIML